MQTNKLTPQEKAVISYLIHSVAVLKVDEFSITDDVPSIFLTETMQNDLRTAFDKINKFEAPKKNTDLSFSESIKEAVLLVLAQFVYAETSMIGKVLDFQPLYLGSTTKANLWKLADLLEIETGYLI